MTQESKVCTRCHQEKPLSEFYPRLILIKKGMVDQDDTGFYSLTDLGKLHAPYRNQHLKVRVIKKIAGEFFSHA